MPTRPIEGDGKRYARVPTARRPPVRTFKIAKRRAAAGDDFEELSGVQRQARRVADKEPGQLLPAKKNSSPARDMITTPQFAAITTERIARRGCPAERLPRIVAAAT